MALNRLILIPTAVSPRAGALPVIRAVAAQLPGVESPQGQGPKARGRQGGWGWAAGVASH